jgi:hypothetical protein
MSSSARFSFKAYKGLFVSPNCGLEYPPGLGSYLQVFAVLPPTMSKNIQLYHLFDSHKSTIKPF